MYWRIVITWSRNWVLNIDLVTLKDIEETIWKDFVSAGPYPQATNTTFSEEVNTTRGQPFAAIGKHQPITKATDAMLSNST